MVEGIQKKLENIGKYGCYFLCLLKGTNHNELDILPYYDLLLEKGLIDEQCTIQDSEAVIKYLTDNLTATYQYSGSLSPNQYSSNLIIIEHRENGFTHFTIWTGKDSEWDPLGKSNTKKIHSYRIFKWR